jgi:8-oxo-dGTP diphosphatase
MHTPSVTTDIVVFADKDETRHVLLIRRLNPPFQDRWALPGGFLDADETVEECAARELYEETHLRVSTLSLVGVFSKPDRDPRSRVLTVAFQSQIPVSQMNDAVAGDDAKSVEWVSIHNLNAERLAFDHWAILQAANQLD